MCVAAVFVQWRVVHKIVSTTPVHTMGGHQSIVEIQQRNKYTSTPHGALKQYSERFSVRFLANPATVTKTLELLTRSFKEYYMKGGLLLTTLSGRAERLVDQVYRPLARVEKLHDIDVCVGVFSRTRFIQKLLEMAQNMEDALGETLSEAIGKSMLPQVVHGADCFFGKVVKSDKKWVTSYAINFSNCTETKHTMILGRIGITVVRNGVFVQIPFVDVTAILATDDLTPINWTRPHNNVERKGILNHLKCVSVRVLGVDCEWCYESNCDKMRRRVSRCVYATLLDTPCKYHEKFISTTLTALDYILRDQNVLDNIRIIPFKCIRKICESAFWNCHLEQYFVNLMIMLEDCFYMALSQYNYYYNR